MYEQKGNCYGHIDECGKWQIIKKSRGDSIGKIAGHY
jgi:hypothetical protein